MTLSQLYENLATLPLFRGISAQELASIADKVHLRWLNIVSDQPFIQADEPCQHIAYLTEGEMTKTTSYDNATYTVTERIKGPCIIEPEQLYGLTCAYQSNYRTVTTCKLLLISKQDIRETLMNIPIWRINLLNHYASMIGKLKRDNEASPYDIKEKIMHFGAERPQTLKIRMIDLAHYLGTSRTTISHILHELESEGKIKMKPNLIEYK